jgi:hypothetical protein
MQKELLSWFCMHYLKFMQTFAGLSNRLHRRKTLMPPAVHFVYMILILKLQYQDIRIHEYKKGLEIN